jgi:hypothetical protein
MANRKRNTREQEAAASEAAREAIEKAGEHSGRRPTNAELEQVADRLQSAGYALLSIYRLAMDAQDNANREFYLLAIQELARSTFRGVDACIGRLTDGDAIGDFATEFDGV